MKLRTVREGEFAGKRVVMRVDYNVSLGRGLKIVDDTRIKHTLPTIKFLLERGAKQIVLMSHLGRPGGKKIERLSLRPVGRHLEELLGRKVEFVNDIVATSPKAPARGPWRDDQPQSASAGPLAGRPGTILLLENLRFWPGEKANDPEFAKRLAEWGEVYVNDAFGVSHRKHASVVGVPRLLPSFAGLSLNREVETILKAVNQPKRPLCVIIGGAKVSDKIGLLFKLIELADEILIGGGMANTFLVAEGYEMQESVVEMEAVKTARELLRKAEDRGVMIHLPSDVVVGNLKTGKHNGSVLVNQIPKGMQALDIGPKTQVEFGKVIAKAGTIVWNGPMGVFEEDSFRSGTDFIYYSLTGNTEAFVVVGGGDTLAAISKKEHLERIDHVSTGGGAMLELIEKGTLPGIEYLVEES